MMSCWKRQPQERMTMKVLNTHLNRLCLMHPDYIDLPCMFKTNCEKLVVKLDCAKKDTFV